MTKVECCADCGVAFDTDDEGRLRRVSIFDLSETGIPVSRYVCRTCRRLWLNRMAGHQESDDLLPQSDPVSGQFSLL